MIISCYCPSNASDKSVITTFYNWLYFIAQLIPKLNVLIIIGDMNAQIDKDEQNKLYLHNLPNRNGEYLADFSLEKSFRLQD